MSATEVLGDPLEREILESEVISGEEPDALIGAMTRTLALEGGPAQTDQTDPELTIEGSGQTLASRLGDRAAADTVVGPPASLSASRLDELTQVEIFNSGHPDDRSGEIIHDRYQLVRQLGKGGMGTVYIARHVNLPKTFAVKVLNRRYAKRKDIADRFLQEAQAVSLINHENVVGVIDFGAEDDGSTFLVMEHLRGEALSTMCKRDAPLPWPRVCHIMSQICRALQSAHDVGIIHRDIKPENVLRVGRHEDEDFIKILDFGLAKMQVSGGLRLTQTGMVLGTPDYMSPEQARGRTADHRTDIYSAGIMMYELLCGRVPFKATTFPAMRQKHLLEPPEPPSKWAPDAGITHEMDAIVLRALAKDPDHRFESMAEMGEAIAAVGTGAKAVELAPPSVPLLSENSVLEKMPNLAGLRGRARGSGVPVGPTLPLGAIDPNALPTKPVVRMEPEPDGSTGSRRGLALALTLVGVAVLAGLVFARSWGLFDRVSDPVSAAAPAPATHARLRFETNVPVMILDEAGEASFGEQPQAELELELERSEQPVQLILRADGHRDLHVVVTPDRDQQLRYELDAAPRDDQPADTK